MDSKEHGSGEAPRIRDAPGPRRNQSIIGPLFQKVFMWPYRVTLVGLYRAGVRPWQLTILSLVMNVVVGWLLIDGQFFLAGILLIPAGLFDVFDGGVARMRGEESRLGAFLDSTLDRVSDGILFGCLFWALAGQGHHTAAILALSTLSISLEVSQIRAEGEALGVKLSEGVFQRLERYVALMVGLTAPGALLPVLAILTALGGITIAQRVWSAWRGLSKPQPPAEQPLQAPATS
ncbi:MAG TPA: CDP-alcohol phosphatidyltransferase family protein [Actinomycetota bacterium]|nr:CDP-alcohol phosphatidyltransferase family protein [Actinomycetota bacterium]